MLLLSIQKYLLVTWNAYAARDLLRIVFRKKYGSTWMIPTRTSARHCHRLVWLTAVSLRRLAVGVGRLSLVSLFRGSFTQRMFTRWNALGSTSDNNFNAATIGDSSFYLVDKPFPVPLPYTVRSDIALSTLSIAIIGNAGDIVDIGYHRFNEGSATEQIYF